ncbi:hypothetical protein BV25DRAFT_928799 [Artomyces pyxidatus]|uniref:Uncharacterized protein n=1 Tax=Artomyces pyxidatus TaxID=48021 RepID=A0ACB8SWJ2_9AGAM|nr:hypothetical protein BV25DRAFT_928799 [Artomyces pyxidatus]
MQLARSNEALTEFNRPVAETKSTRVQRSTIVPTEINEYREVKDKPRSELLIASASAMFVSVWFWAVQSNPIRPIQWVEHYGRASPTPNMPVRAQAYARSISPCVGLRRRRSSRNSVGFPSQVSWVSTAIAAESQDVLARGGIRTIGAWISLTSSSTGEILAVHSLLAAP